VIITCTTVLLLDEFCTHQSAATDKQYNNSKNSRY